MSLSFSNESVKNEIINNDKHYKLIILIIASHSETYDLFIRCWREYMNNFSDVRSFLLFSDENIETDILVTEDCIIHKSNESTIPGIFFKSTASFSICDKFFSYDYILRTNLSSFYHIPRLLCYMEKKPKDNYAGGQWYNLPNIPSKNAERTIVNKYLGLELHDKFIFLHGAGFVLSRSIVKKYLNEFKTNPEKVAEALKLSDDVAISLLLYNFLKHDPSRTNEVQYYHPDIFENTYINKYQPKNIEDPKQFTDETIFHFRNKSDDSCVDTTLNKRKIDVFNYVNQIRHFYNKPNFMDDVFSKDGKEIDLSFRKKMIDCFIFYNEIDMLLYRLTVLNDVIDFFVLVESTRTHTGNLKSLYYSENKHLFTKFNDKIIHIIIDDMPIPDISKNEQWLNENYQRNAIDRGVKCLGLKEKDFVVICDIDEIPDPTILKQIKEQTHECDFIALKQHFYYYNLNSLLNEILIHPKLIRYDIYLKMDSSPQNIRMAQGNYLIEKGGWHLSYFGDTEFIKNKLENFPHQEFNTEDIKNEESMKFKIDNGLDILDRPDAKITRIPISENKYLPPFYDTMLSKFILY
jgi:beta-1,4-mannosyl-glycoprotein beta-1,4-N-acetylglucosaminyltransferase